jgi:hypothetical protein
MNSVESGVKSRMISFVRIPEETGSQWTRKVIISVLCSINASKPIRTAVLVEVITNRFEGASGGAPVLNIKMSDMVETINVSEREEMNFFLKK